MLPMLDGTASVLQIRTALLSIHFPTWDVCVFNSSFAAQLHAVVYLCGSEIVCFEKCDVSGMFGKDFKNTYIQHC